MPTIDIIDGININIYNGDHNPPHIHAIYGEYEIRINIKTGKPMKGGMMPITQMRKIEGWLKDSENYDMALRVFKTLNRSLRS